MRLSLSNNKDWFRNKEELLSKNLHKIAIPDKLIEIYTLFSDNIIIPEFTYYSYANGGIEYKVQVGYIEYDIYDINIYLNRQGYKTTIKDDIIYLNDTDVQIYKLNNKLIIDKIDKDTFMFDIDSKNIKDFDKYYDILWDSLKNTNILEFKNSLCFRYFDNKIKISLLSKIKLYDKNQIPSLNEFKCTNKSICKSDLELCND